MQNRKSLSAAFVASVKKQPNNCCVDKYFDGRGTGLILEVQKNGSKNWKQRLRIKGLGKRREIGLGGYPCFSLAEVRETALENHKAARAGRDILAERREQALEKAAQASYEHFTRQRYDELVAAKKWKNKKHAGQWISTQVRYVFPIIGDRPVCEVKPQEIKKVLMQQVKGGIFWHARAETAARVKQRMGVVFASAVAEGLRADNPVLAITGALPPQNAKIIPHKSLDYSLVPGAIAAMHAQGNPTQAMQQEWQILTATRPGETKFARLSEIDWEDQIWTIPATRMKNGKPFRVPLSNRAVEIAVSIRDGGRVKGHDLMFVSVSTGKPYADTALKKMRINAGIDATAHGWRSSFRVWVQEQTSTEEDVAEMCLAHSIGGKTKMAYARSDLLDKRRVVMQGWADFLAGKTSM